MFHIGSGLVLVFKSGYLSFLLIQLLLQLLSILVLLPCSRHVFKLFPETGLFELPLSLSLLLFGLLGLCFGFLLGHLECGLLAGSFLLSLFFLLLSLELGLGCFLFLLLLQELCLSHQGTTIL
jgi:hypothetical protein